jgi:hypothetical protein
MPHLEPTYLRYIYDSLNKGSIHPENASELPEGLIGLYEEAFDDRTSVVDRQKLLKRFAIWALLKKEVSTAFVADLLNEPEEEIQVFISTYSSLFNSPESGKYQLYHERLKVYLLQKLSEGELRQLHDKLVVRLEQAIEEQKADEFERYGLEFLGNYKFINATTEGEETAFIQFALNSENWQRQRQISNDFSWSKKMVGESIILKIKGKREGLSESILALLKISLTEQNEYNVILNLVENNEFELCLQRLHFFGGKSLRQGKRRFLLTLELLKRILISSLDISEKRKFISTYLEFVENEISIEKYLFNWNEFLPFSYVFEIIAQLLQIEIIPDALINKTNQIEFDEKYIDIINKDNLGQFFELIEKSNWTVIDKFSSKLNLCEFAIQNQIDIKQINNQLCELLSNASLIQNNIGSKLFYGQLINSLLLTKSYKEILSSSFFETEDYQRILIDTIVLHIVEHQLFDDDFFHSFSTRVKNNPAFNLINDLITYLLTTDGSSECSFLNDESFNDLIYKYRIQFQIYIFLKQDNNSKSEFYWFQLISTIQREISESNQKPSSSDIIYIFENLLKTDCKDEIQQLFQLFKVYLDEESLLKLIAKVNFRNKTYFNECLIENFLIKNEISKGSFFDTGFSDSLISFCRGDMETGLLSIEHIDNDLHKDYLFKLLLLYTGKEQKLINAYLSFRYSISKVKATDSKTRVEALKFLEEQKIKGEGTIDLFQLKSRIVQSGKKPVHYFQFSQNEYLHQIVDVILKKGNLIEAQKIQQLIKDPFTFDLVLFETIKDLVLNKKSKIDLAIIDKFKTIKFQWQAQHFISKAQYQRDGNFQGALDTLSKINLLSNRIQGYFNCLEISVEKNDGYHQELFELIELNFTHLGEGDVYQKGKDKFGRLTILTKNSFVLIRLQKDDFLINQLTKYSLKDRFLAYLTIAEICRVNDEIEIAKKYFKRVYKQLDKIANISDEVEIRCEIIQHCSYLKFESTLTDNLSSLREIIEKSQQNNEKSLYALKVIMSFLKVKRFKRSHEFFVFLSNPEDHLELVRFIGSHFSSSLRAIYLSELNIFIKSNLSLQEMAKTKIDKLNIDEYSDANLAYSYFVQNDNETLYKLLTGWFLNELYINHRPLGELTEYSEILNLQWAIDIKNQLPN